MGMRMKETRMGMGTGKEQIIADIGLETNGKDRRLCNAARLLLRSDFSSSWRLVVFM